MTRRVRITWPDPRLFESRGGQPIRLLAASDEPDPALESSRNRDALAPIDGIVGAGDLEPHWLQFLADAWDAPLAFVTGNHDRGGAWESTRPNVPEPIAAGRVVRIAGLRVAGLPWPGRGEHGNVRDEWAAWRHALGLAVREALGRLRGRADPLLVLSHAPPAGAGDGPDAYHLGFAAYRWLLERLRPPLWLHGHVTTASVPDLEVRAGSCTLVNVTGSVLVELVPPDRPARASAAGARGSG